MLEGLDEVSTKAPLHKKSKSWRSHVYAFYAFDLQLYGKIGKLSNQKEYFCIQMVC